MTYAPPLVHGVLAFTDALGFKGIWQRADPAAVVAKFDRLLSEAGQLNRYPLSVDGLSVHLRMMSLSDTVVVACSSEVTDARFGESGEFVADVASLVTVLNVSANLAAGLVAANPPAIACRGAVALGGYYLDPDRNLLLGPAIDEAAENEKLADGALIWLSPGLDTLLNELVPSAISAGSLAGAAVRRLIEGTPVVRNYPVPLKGGPPLRTSVVNPFGAKRSDHRGNVTPLFDHDRIVDGFRAAFANDAVNVRRKAQVTFEFLEVAGREPFAA
jgi:hypothetical protein